ncbi:alkaline phosphatase PafA [Poritiphilus flavus]|uniref:Alkaline phosphatase family protein n=1 Tax=Poritiphilus flavus TaxID=2697053 RepID=A0A6L9EI44_9FLAO|nr:alkaline phosphatase PafA [Poritiphilus flavus]NAS14158.1 alkaline phosphatase family protein [Poritiphilus flavus]
MIHKRITLIIAVIFTAFMVSPALPQRKSKNKEQSIEIKPPFARPKLVVGIVVDQMRYDYLTRFWNHYGNGGFKRLVAEGFNCKNNHFDYAQTKTGPGHASVYTGTTPANHGILANDWYDRQQEKEVYCASDDSRNTIGTNSDAGKMSPHRLQVTTITDQLRLHYQQRSKVIAIAIKDRGAVLPGGHMANAAYWFEGEDTGQWISSSYYMNQLPQWVINFNASGKIKAYKQAWNTYKNISEYIESAPDNSPYEGVFEDEASPVFPHSTPNLLSKERDFEILKYTPFGNSLTTDFAIEALQNEQLGTDPITDFLAVSFSSTDYVGHKYGVNSKEVQDTYIRLDRDLERLLNTLDLKVGAGAYTVFLTADHGAIPAPGFLKARKFPAGFMREEEVKLKLEEFLKYSYGTTDILMNISNDQLFLDRRVVQNLDLELSKVQETLAAELLSYGPYSQVYTAHQMKSSQFTAGIPYLLQKGYNHAGSGDVLMVLKPGFIEYRAAGSTHGSPHPYDTHVPLLFFGNGIRQGSTVERTEISDIAPTISALLGIAFPNGATGMPVSQVLK